MHEVHDASSSAPKLSIVIPGLNEAESIPELTRGIHETLRGQLQYEVVFVDDGSTDDTWKVIEDLHRQDPVVRGVRLRANFGKATALVAGFEHARGEILMMMDADLQDDPKEIPKFLEKLEEGADLVVGWKVDRLDAQNRLVLSRIFNTIVGLVTKVKLHDMNCGFKAFRREVVDNIHIYGDQFRFIPVLAAAKGFCVAEVPVHHHARKYGASRYGLERILRGFFDLLTVFFLTRYARQPMHFFGLPGLVSSGLGLLCCLYLTVLWFLGESIGTRPLLLLGVLLLVIGIQFFFIGLIGEFLTYNRQTGRKQSQLPVSQTIGVVNSRPDQT